MKLLPDEHISRRILSLLLPHYSESTQVALVGLQNSDDRAVWDYARQHGFVVVSKDSDFHELSLLRGPPPFVIWLKLGNASNDDVAAALIRRLRAIEDAFAGGIRCVEIYSTGG